VVQIVPIKKQNKQYTTESSTRYGYYLVCVIIMKYYLNLILKDTCQSMSKSKEKKNQ